MRRHVCVCVCVRSLSETGNHAFLQAAGWPRIEAMPDSSATHFVMKALGLERNLHIDNMSLKI